MATRRSSVAVTARRLSAQERAAMASWMSTAVLSDRAIALESVLERARLRGRAAAVREAMDDAFGSVVESAGAQRYSYWAEDRGSSPSWDAAGQMAAWAAAAEAAADLIGPDMKALLADPWNEVVSRDIRRR